VKISEATALIRTPVIEWVRPQSWCDLGCGSGTFTTALAQLLAPGSRIHAVDFDQRALERISRPTRWSGDFREQVSTIQSITLTTSESFFVSALLTTSGHSHLLLKIRTTTRTTTTNIRLLTTTTIINLIVRFQK
jgi:trans-aconitate methyltransferase